MASMGINQNNLDSSANLKGETFVEFVKIEIVSPEHPNGGFTLESDG